ASRVASVKWTIAGTGGASGTATGPAGGPWTFSKNLAKLTAGSHTLTVTGLGANHQPVAGASFKGTLKVTKLPLTFNVQAGYAGAAPGPLKQLRFLQKVPLAIDFSGAVAGLPSYYQHNVQVRYDGKQA